MNTFNHLICSFFDLVFYPFASLNPLWGLIVTSVATGIMMLLIFRYVSDQEGIRKTKNRITARIFELRLFQHDLGVMLETQKHLLKDNLTYLTYSIRPILLMILPVVVIMIQTSLWFSSYALRVGNSTIVKIKFNEQAAFEETTALRVPEGILIETPPLRIPEKKEIAWRIKAEKEGTYDLTFELHPAIVTKSVFVSDRLARISARRVSTNILQRFLYPGEKHLPNSAGLEYIEVSYPALTYRIFGWEAHWLAIFLVVSIAAGFMLKKFFGVQL